MGERRRRLIEVAFPLEEVSAHSRREKNVRHGHISTLHIWWARRPLAACRAFIYASLVDDPDTDKEREELLKEVADLASWDAVRKPDQVVRPREKGGSGLTGVQLLERARQRILDCNGGKPPRLLDPFAGGGAIPLEALRLGCEVEASDLNPVAVLILKGTVEYPQRYGRPLAEQVEQKRRGERDSIAGVNGDVPPYIREAADSRQASFVDGDLEDAYRRNPLATDVRYWGNWMLERARKDLAQFYPPDPDGSVPVAYLWSRTVPCPNCGAEMPLIRQYWLARKDKKKVALKPVLDRENKRVDFEVVEGEDVTGDPAEATAALGDTICLLCRQVLKGPYVREAGKSGHMGGILTAVVVTSPSTAGKVYRMALLRDRATYQRAQETLVQLGETGSIDGLGPVPDEPMPTRAETTGGVVSAFGLDTYGKLFNARQLLALTTFSKLARESHSLILDSGLDGEYAEAVTTYLGLAVDKMATRGSALGLWDASRETVTNVMADGSLPMTWDYPEAVLLGEGSGSAESAFEFLISVLGELSQIPGFARCSKADARFAAGSFSLILTDPPYYDAFNYAILSDFFYVWLKRSLAGVHDEILNFPLTPKREQIVMSLGRAEQPPGTSRDEAAKRLYVTGMAQSFQAVSDSVGSGGLVNVVFAHTDPDAWATLIEGLLTARLVPHASWPIDTEQQTGTTKIGKTRLKTSVWMVCRPRREDVGEAFVGDVMEEMRPVIRERLLYFWGKGIRGADFFISAIGPALSVFGRHSRVLRPDGTEVGVRDFLDLVRKEATQVALEQVLMGADLGAVDRVTRQYVTWVWSYSRAPLEAGETIALCLATGADYREAVRPGSIAVEVKEKSKKMVTLRTIRERGRQDEGLGEDSPARPAPLIDQLQRAAYLWGLNRPEELGAYRASQGETRWAALRTLGQAVAECLPDGDEDRRLIHGLLGSNVMASAPPRTASIRPAPPTAGGPLPGFEEAMKTDA